MENQVPFSKHPSVLMVLENEFPFDERVEKEAVLLVNAGYEVHLACFTRKNKKPKEMYKGISIHRFFLSGFYYKLSAACLIIPAYFRRWRRFMESLYNEYPFDIVHVHDLPLTKPAYQLVKKNHGKLVCDQHEFYSDWIIRTAHYSHTLAGRIIRFFSNWKKYERKYLGKADLVITVEEPLRQIYIDKVGIQPEKMIVLPNTPLRSVFRDMTLMDDVIDRYRTSYLLLYIGGIDIQRGIECAVRAMPSLVKRIPHIRLLLIGPVMKQYDPLGLSEAIGIRQFVEHIPWISLSEIPSYIAASSICFFTPPSDSEVINRTIATKIYQYMAMGKPVIVGRAKMMKDFVERQAIGVSIDESRPESFAEAVIKLYEDEGYKKKLSSNALSVSEHYFWEKTSTPLLEKYKSFSG